MGKTQTNPGRAQAEGPKPETPASKSGIFVVQKHHARTLHYDFRLEMDGVLKSWAVPKGPSPKPGQRRLAMATEDHALDYANFEGEIPEGHYGAGTVEIWDRGTYTLRLCSAKQIKFQLFGKKLKGNYALVHWTERRWLLIKEKNER